MFYSNHDAHVVSSCMENCLKSHLVLVLALLLRQLERIAHELRTVTNEHLYTRASGEETKCDDGVTVTQCRHEHIFFNVWRDLARIAAPRI